MRGKKDGVIEEQNKNEKKQSDRKEMFDSLHAQFWDHIWVDLEPFDHECWREKEGKRGQKKEGRAKRF